MECFVINSNEIEGRLDCRFYRPEFTKLDKKVKCISNKILADYILSISGGATPDIKESGKYYSDSTEGVPFLRVQNVTPEGLNLDDVKFINKETHNEMLKRSQVNEYNLLVKITGVGRMAVSSVAPKGFVGNINQHLVMIKTENESTSNVLAVFLNSDIGERLATKRATGGTRPALDYEALKSIPIVFKPKIISVYEKAIIKKTRIKSEAQQLLDSINEYVIQELNLDFNKKGKSIFYVESNKIINRLDPLYYSIDVYFFLEKLKYPLATIGEVSLMLKTGFAAGRNDQDLEEEGIVQIRPTNISKTRQLIFDKCIYIKEEEKESLVNELVRKGEILFNNTNSQELVGKSTYFDIEGNYFCSNHITRINVDTNKVNPIYLTQLLNTYQLNNLFFRICTNWNNQSGVNIDLLKTVKIPFPSLAVQNKIAEEVKKRMQKAEQLQKEAKDELENAKQEVEKIILGDN